MPPSTPKANYCHKHRPSATSSRNERKRGRVFPRRCDFRKRPPRPMPPHPHRELLTLPPASRLHPRHRPGLPYLHTVQLFLDHANITTSSWYLKPSNWRSTRPFNGLTSRGG